MQQATAPAHLHDRPVLGQRQPQLGAAAPQVHKRLAQARAIRAQHHLHIRLIQVRCTWLQQMRLGALVSSGQQRQVHACCTGGGGQVPSQQTHPQAASHACPSTPPVTCTAGALQGRTCRNCTTSAFVSWGGKPRSLTKLQGCRGGSVLDVSVSSVVMCSKHGRAVLQHTSAELLHWVCGCCMAPHPTPPHPTHPSSNGTSSSLMPAVRMPAMPAARPHRRGEHIPNQEGAGKNNAGLPRQ